MRRVWLGLIIAGSTACTPSAVQFEHQSELGANTRGVALAADGADGVAGMFGTTCRVTVATADIGADYDFPTNEEMVVDNSMMFGDAAVLVLSDFGAHVTYPDNTWNFDSDDFNTPGVVDGMIFEEGVTLLVDDGTEGCKVEWNSGSDVASTAIPGAFCDAAIAVDRSTGQAFVANGDEILSVTQDGYTVIGTGADLVVWDGSASVLYAALTGDSSFWGYEANGATRFEIDLGGAVTAMDTMGPVAQAAVMVEKAGGAGALITVDGNTGEILSTLATPSAVDEIDLSDNGRSMALVLPREVHFFNVKSAY